MEHGWFVSPDIVSSLVMAAGPPQPQQQQQQQQQQQLHQQPAAAGASKRPRPEELGPEELGAALTHHQQRRPQPQPAPLIADGVTLAVIVPFRDQPEQNRAAQLARFSDALPRFLRSAAVRPALRGLHVIVVEQSMDGFKFNRGKALQVCTHKPYLTYSFS